MYMFVLVIDILLALGITVLVLLQRSEGGMGGLSGQSANSFLTARQAGNALSKLTKWFFVAFCVTTLALMIMAKNANTPKQIDLMPAAPASVEYPTTAPAGE